MELKSGTSGSQLVAAVPWYEQAGALGLGTVVLGALSLLAGLGVLVLASLGGVWPVFDIASHFAMHAAGTIAGGLLAVFLVWRGWTKLGFASLPLVASLTVIVPASIANLSTWNTADLAAPAPGTVRIVSLNTWHAQTDLDLLLEFLESVQADIVVLTEFGPNKTHFRKRLAQTYNFQAGCAEIVYCSMQLLSRHPIRHSSTLSRHLRTGPPTVMATFGPELRGLRVIGVHFMRPIDSYLGNYREVTQIADLAADLEPAPVVVAGDFNLTGWSWNWSTFRNRSGLKHMGRFLPSWPAQPRGIPQLAIDHIFASPDITFERVGLGTSVGSDHRPLIADIRLPE